MTKKSAIAVDGELWAESWLEDVRAGRSSMSQRKLESVERLGGGFEVVRAVAMRKGVHLLVLRDDKGNELVAASAHAFRVIC